MADEQLPAPAETKKPWLSKTLWMNALLAGSAFVPSIHGWAVAHTEFVMSAFGVLNMLLRFITKDKISLQD